MLVALNLGSKVYCFGYGYHHPSCYSNRPTPEPQPSDDFERIFKRIYQSNTEKIKRFVEKYGHIPGIINIISQNKKWDRTGITPLSFALDSYFSSRREEPALLLLDAAAVDVNTKDSYGNTPLHLACLNSFPKSVEKLLQRGANLHVKNERGNNPMHMCLQIIGINGTNCMDHRKKGLVVAELLMNNGGKDLINEINLAGKTPFQEIFDNESFEKCEFRDKVIMYFLAMGAKLDDQAMQDCDEETKKRIDFVNAYNTANDKLKFIFEKEKELEMGHAFLISTKLASICNEFKEKQFSFDLEKELKLVIEDYKKLDSDQFKFLLKFVLYSSIMECQESKKQNSQDFHGTVFYEYYTKSKNRKNIENMLSLPGTENIYDFVITAAKNNDFCFDEQFWIKKKLLTCAPVIAKKELVSKHKDYEDIVFDIND